MSDPIELAPEQGAAVIRQITSFFIADGHDAKLAQVTVRPQGDGFFLGDVWTHPDHRHKGWANALMEEAIEEFGLSPIYLYTSAYCDAPLDDEQLTEWYASFGFKAVPGFPGGMMRPATPEGDE
jgi:ribosomal protein S18 acetylase RimI-like enzyme